MIPNIELSSGTLIPQLGLGTYKMVDGTTEIVMSAIDVGYRHIDTAQMYGNEAEIGKAVAQSGVARDELFLTSKLNNPNHKRDDAKRSFEQTLKDLQTDYVDLFLIHWPLPMLYDGRFDLTWSVLEEFYEEGTARAIGVSNFEPHHLDLILASGNVKPAVNQVESHPFMHNTAVHVYDGRHGIATEAWSPLARGAVNHDAVLAGIGAAHGKTATQVAIRWALQRGDIVIPKASTAERQKENLDVFDFELSDEEIAAIITLDRGEAGRTGIHPDKMDRM